MQVLGFKKLMKPVPFIVAEFCPVMQSFILLQDTAKEMQCEKCIIFPWTEIVVCQNCNYVPLCNSECHSFSSLGIYTIESQLRFCS